MWILFLERTRSEHEQKDLHDPPSCLIFINNTVFQRQDTYYADLKGTTFIHEFFCDNCTEETKIGHGFHGSIFRIVVKEFVFVIKQTIKDCEKNITLITRLDRKFLAKYFETFTHHDLFYTVMEHINGHTLQKATEKFIIKPNGLQQIYFQILNAVRYLHSLDLTHNDISPLNLMCEVYNYHIYNVKIIDYNFLGAKTFARNKYWYPWPIKEENLMVNDLKSLLLIIKTFEECKTMVIGDIMTFKDIELANKEFQLPYGQLNTYLQNHYCLDHKIDMVPIVPKPYPPNRKKKDHGYNNEYSED